MTPEEQTCFQINPVSGFLANLTSTAEQSVWPTCIISTDRLVYSWCETPTATRMAPNFRTRPSISKQPINSNPRPWSATTQRAFLAQTRPKSARNLSRSWTSPPPNRIQLRLLLYWRLTQRDVTKYSPSLPKTRSSSTQSLLGSLFL